MFNVLYTFTGADDGYGPYTGLTRGPDGKFYGVTYALGVNQSGTVFRLTPPVGNVQLDASTSNVAASAGTVTLQVNRTGGSAGAVSVNYATGDGTANAGVDYQPVSGTLSWADGDTDPKTISVPVIDRGLSSGSTQFFVNLTSPTGGAGLTAPVQAGVNILAADPAGNLLAVTLLSPPSDVTLTPNLPVTLEASVDALANTLANVEFFVVDRAGNATDLGGFSTQRGQVTWTPVVPGDFTLRVVATDTQGKTKRATSPIHVAVPDNAGVIPRSTLNGGLNRRTVALGDTVTVTALAVDANGDPLQNAQFYLDGVPLDTNPLTLAAPAPGPRTNADGSVTRTSADTSASNLIQTNATIAKLEQLLTVLGTNAQGVSVVSNASSLFAKANAGTPPTAAITNLTSGAVVPSGASGQVVSVSADSSGDPLAKVELIVDNQSAGVAASAPYTFTLPALGEGSHVISAIATTLNALSKVSAPVVVQAAQSSGHPAFFGGETALANGVYYLALPSGNPFGYYSYLDDPAYLYHFDLGFEYLFDANDGKSGVYFYDFASSTFFYTSPTFPFPYLYDFSLNTVLYYYPNPGDPQHYNTNGIRYFLRFDTGAIFSK